VHDRESFLDALRGGRPRGESARKFAIAVDAYPGFETLLSRI
jgi:hypothetical protein